MPHEPVRTARARAALPGAGADGRRRLQRRATRACSCSGLGAATGTSSRAGSHDRLHQPHRAHLYPRSLALARARAELGALGATISGAGPTVLVWCTARTRRGPVRARLRGGVRGLGGRAPRRLRAARRRGVGASAPSPGGSARTPSAGGLLHSSRRRRPTSAAAGRAAGRDPVQCMARRSAAAWRRSSCRRRPAELGRVAVEAGAAAAVVIAWRPASASAVELQLVSRSSASCWRPSARTARAGHHALSCRCRCPGARRARARP